jgi:hypothetical protein
LTAALNEVSKHDSDEAAYEDDDSASEPEDTNIRTQIMHGHLPPVDVELSIEFGGVSQGQSDCRTICIQVTMECSWLGIFVRLRMSLEVSSAVEMHPEGCGRV